MSQTSVLCGNTSTPEMLLPEAQTEYYNNTNIIIYS